MLGAPGPDFGSWEGMNSRYFFILSETSSIPKTLYRSAIPSSRWKNSGKLIATDSAP
jgi:hypothetical protein